METGDIIKKLRNEKKITQTELGVMLGVNTSSIQKYESGATKNLKLETIRELCHIFDVPPIVFVFPEIYNVDYSKCMKGPKWYKHSFMELFNVNEEGSNKIMEYIVDIQSIGKYKSQDKSR